MMVISNSINTMFDEFTNSDKVKVHVIYSELLQNTNVIHDYWVELTQIQKKILLQRFNHDIELLSGNKDLTMP